MNGSKKSFLGSLLAATTTRPGTFLPFAPFTLKHADELAIVIKARGAERALTVALDWLGEIVVIVPLDDLRADVSLLVQLLDLAAKFEVLRAKLNQFELEVGGVDHKVGREVLQFSVMQFLRDFANLFDAGNNIVDHTHGYSTSYAAVELIKALDAGCPATAERRKRLLDLAEAVICSEAGIIRQFPKQEEAAS